MKTAIEIIKRSLSILRVYSQEQPLQASDRDIALERLNDLANSWQTQYGHLWLYQEAVVLMEQSKERYSLGTDRIVDFDELVVTELSTAVSSGTAITVDAAGSTAVSDKIGIELDSGNIHWTTVAAISGNNITLTAAIPSAAAEGNTVYAYTAVIERPLRVTQARYADRFDVNQVPSMMFSRQEYFDQPNKGTTGTTTNWYYSPQLDNGYLYVWPTASSNLSCLFITCVRPFNLTATNASEIDFPDEWASALAYNLAKDMLDEYGVPLDRQQAIIAKADEKLSNNLAFDNSAAGLAVEIDRGY